MKKLIFFCFLTFAFLLPLSAQEKMPKVMREFRGMWITTVGNYDFPSKPDLTAEQQKAELITYLDLATELRMNAVIFQVRSMGDAVYQSNTEPWSGFLTSELGKKSEFDPLRFLIDEAHARGILVHVWFNPYRTTSPNYKGIYPDSHISKRHPEWLRQYDNYSVLDPGLKEAQDYLVGVVSEVVNKYDIDGVVFDDYFYPYPKNEMPFHDEETFEAYKKAGGKLGLEDWRRKNVNDFIQTVGTEIKKNKPNVMFGISPFGIWKPDDISIKGTSAYDALFADSRKWLQEGWVDYLAPQLYWSSNKEGQKFATLLNWWKGENKKKKHLWAGLATYKVGDANYPDFTTDEAVLQVNTTRGQLGDDAGAIHFRAKFLADNQGGIKDVLKEKAYRGNAIIPPSPWIDSTLPSPPELRFTKQSNGDVLVNWKNTGAKPAFRWVLYWDDGKGWKPTVLAPTMMQANLQAAMSVQKIGIAAVDRLGNISQPTIKEVK